MSRAADLNEMMYMESLLSIDFKNLGGKVVFGIIKGSKSKDYIDGNAALTLEKFSSRKSSMRSQLFHC